MGRNVLLSGLVCVLMQVGCSTIDESGADGGMDPIPRDGAADTRGIVLLDAMVGQDSSVGDVAMAIDQGGGDTDSAVSDVGAEADVTSPSDMAAGSDLGIAPDVATEPDAVALCVAFAAAVCARGTECVGDDAGLIARLAFCSVECDNLNEEERAGYLNQVAALNVCIASIATAQCDPKADPSGFLFNAIIETEACAAWSNAQN